MENLPFWTDQRLTWGAVGFMAYCERLSITQIDDADLPSFLRGAYFQHPDHPGDLEEVVNELLALGYFQREGSTIYLYGEGVE